MLKTGADVFLRLPSDSNERILHRGTAIALEGDLVTLRLEKWEGDLEGGLDVLIYYEIESQFVQQSAAIEGVLEAESQPMVQLRIVGDPISAESRECQRVTTVSVDVTASVAGERDCEVRDLSAVGFAVISTRCLSAGQVVSVSLQYEGRECSGDVCVQSFRELSRGRWRYGLGLLGDQRRSGGLQRWLIQLGLQLRREQLRRA